MSRRLLSLDGSDFILGLVENNNKFSNIWNLKFFLFLNFESIYFTRLIASSKIAHFLFAKGDVNSVKQHT